jgi:uncharacterized protein YuzE
VHRLEAEFIALLKKHGLEFAQPSVDSREVQDGVVIEIDEKGQTVGIDIQHASEILDLATLETESLPLRV